jgi:hypothetical protein
LKNSKNEKVENWIKEIHNISEELNLVLGNFDSELLYKKPSPEKWSISQIIEHIIKTNESYFSIPEQIKNGNYKLPAISKIPLIPKLFGKTILSSVKPTNERKVKTFPVWEPNLENKQNNILNLILEHNKSLIDFLRNNVDLIEKETIISSPANKNIVYSFETAIEILISHEQRHMNQIKETLNLI